MDYFFSDRIMPFQPETGQELLRLSSQPDMIRFAAGNPAPDAFPVQDIAEITAKLMKTQPIDALQYGMTEGYEPLRNRIRKYEAEKHNIGGPFDQLIITNGASQVIDLATKVFCNEGDTVVVETPSYIGSLCCFRAGNLQLKGVPVENNGIDIDRLEHTLRASKNVRFIYTIPNFQNPTGITMSLEKRRALYELARKYHTLIVEDNPYGELRVTGKPIPSIKSLDEDGRVIYAGSFSKILAPGIRVGYVIAPAAIIGKMIVGKQVEDVHTSMLSQLIVNEWMENYNFESHIKKIRTIYKRKLHLMCDRMDEYLDNSVTYLRPEGGLFIWCTFPDGKNMLEMVKKALLHKVAVLPGTMFLAEQSEITNAVRMNFSTPSDAQIEEGIRILGTVWAG